MCLLSCSEYGVNHHLAFHSAMFKVTDPNQFIDLSVLPLKNLDQCGKINFCLLINQCSTVSCLILKFFFHNIFTDFYCIDSTRFSFSQFSIAFR